MDLPECTKTTESNGAILATPDLERDLSVRRFEAADTRRVHNLFLEESRCLIWPMFVETLRSPCSLLLHLCLLFGLMSMAPSCIFALFGVIFGASATFASAYKRFYFYLRSSLRGDLSNISQVRMNAAQFSFISLIYGLPPNWFSSWVKWSFRDVGRSAKGRPSCTNTPFCYTRINGSPFPVKIG